ncbi:hypothetical protein QVD17_03725 [Tagetes erecta]|uniref:Uncharacterized protein n=1 Tax=Tagetes erecta TaxID=13708 RepID=A0AAD8P3M4_TARER|nr:hypothetical protein QVD17_03725 [Tagetes erecta]
MKAKFFMCIRPLVIETDDEHYKKPPPAAGSPYTTVSGKSSGRRNRDLLHRKRVAPEKCSPENPLQKDKQKALKITTPVTEPCISKSFSDEETVCVKKKLSMVSNNEVNDGVKSNSGGYVMNDGSDVGLSENMVVGSPEKGLAEEGSPEEYRKRVIMAGLLERKNHYR